MCSRSGRRQRSDAAEIIQDGLRLIERGRHRYAAFPDRCLRPRKHALKSARAAARRPTRRHTGRDAVRNTDWNLRQGDGLNQKRETLHDGRTDGRLSAQRASTLADAKRRDGRVRRCAVTNHSSVRDSEIRQNFAETFRSTPGSDAQRKCISDVWLPHR